MPLTLLWKSTRKEGTSTREKLHASTLTEVWSAAFGGKQWQPVEQFALKVTTDEFIIQLPSSFDFHEELRSYARELQQLKDLLYAVLSKVTAIEAQSPKTIPAHTGILQPTANEPEMALMNPTHAGVLQPTASEPEMALTTLTRAGVQMPILKMTTPTPTCAGVLQATADQEEDILESKNRRLV